MRNIPWESGQLSHDGIINYTTLDCSGPANSWYHPIKPLQRRLSQIELPWDARSQQIQIGRLVSLFPHQEADLPVVREFVCNEV